MRDQAPLQADDLLRPEFRADPYPLYAALREAAPVHRVERLNMWLVMRYADVNAGLRDPRLSSERRPAGAHLLPAELQARLVPFYESVQLWALFRDPPYHTRVRALLNKAFVPGMVEGMRGRIAAL